MPLGAKAKAFLSTVTRHRVMRMGPCPRAPARRSRMNFKLPGAEHLILLGTSCLEITRSLLGRLSRPTPEQAMLPNQHLRTMEKGWPLAPGLHLHSPSPGSTSSSVLCKAPRSGLCRETVAEHPCTEKIPVNRIFSMDKTTFVFYFLISEKAPDSSLCNHRTPQCLSRTGCWQ